MTAPATALNPPTMRNTFRRLVERLLPWYDPEVERRRAANTEELRQRSIRARIEAERVRDAYLAYAERLERP